MAIGPMLRQGHKSSPKTKIPLATRDHERALTHNGATVSVPGMQIDPGILPTGKPFPIATKKARFDIAGMSL